MSRVIVLCALGCLVLATGANAGLLVVSGDSNIANFIDGSAEAGGLIVPGNATFFGNLIGAGSTVMMQEPTDTFTDLAEEENAIINYYNSLGKTVTAGTAFPSTLAGANLFISLLPNSAYTTPQIAAISAFLSGGGTVLLIGEYIAYDPSDGNSDANLNALLTALGSPMQLSGNYGHGAETLTGAEIASNPLTAGVSRFGYADMSTVTGGTPLFIAPPTDGTTGQPIPFVECTGCAVPEPSSAVLLGTGVVAIGILVLRRCRSAAWHRFRRDA